jgi:hypothetical protein
VTQQQNPFSTVSKPRRGGGLLLTVTLVVAVLGLVVGVAGVAVASIALGRSDKAVNLAGSVQAVPPAGPTTAPTADPTSVPTNSTQDTDGADPSATPTEIDPSAQFTVAYQEQHLRVRSPNCNDGYFTYVDLDEPRVVGDDHDKAELSYSGCGPGQIRTDLAFGQLTGPNATPADCLDKIRTDPGHSPIAPTTGMTLCFVTSEDYAASHGITQKLAFLTVDSLATDNETGVLNVTAKAWIVPR